MFFLFAFSRSSVEDDIISELKSIRSSLNEIRSILETPQTEKQVSYDYIPRYTHLVKASKNPVIRYLYTPSESEESPITRWWPVNPPKKYRPVIPVQYDELFDEGEIVEEADEEIEAEVEKPAINSISTIDSIGHPRPSFNPMKFLPLSANKNDKEIETEVEDPTLNYSSGGHPLPSYGYRGISSWLNNKNDEGKEDKTGKPGVNSKQKIGIIPPPSRRFLDLHRRKPHKIESN